MFKKLNKKGYISIWVALSAPVILLFMFMLFDGMNYLVYKQNAQRQLDSAVLSIAQSAMPKDGDLVDENGFIVDSSMNITNKKVCAITDENFQVGISQLNRLNGPDVIWANEWTSKEEIQKHSMAIYNVSDAEQLESGVVRIQAKGYVPWMMSGMFSGLNIKYPYLIESYAVCSSSISAIQDRYSINYILNGGVLNNPINYYTKGDSFGLPSPTKSGSAFLGWYEDASLTRRVSGIKPSDTGNKVFYAKWS